MRAHHLRKHQHQNTCLIFVEDVKTITCSLSVIRVDGAASKCRNSSYKQTVSVSDTSDHIIIQNAPTLDETTLIQRVRVNVHLCTSANGLKKSLVNTHLHIVLIPNVKAARNSRRRRPPVLM